MDENIHKKQSRAGKLNRAININCNKSSSKTGGSGKVIWRQQIRIGTTDQTTKKRKGQETSRWRDRILGKKGRKREKKKKRREKEGRRTGNHNQTAH